MAGHDLEFEKPIVEIEKKIEELKSNDSKHKKEDVAKQLQGLESEAVRLKKTIYQNLTPWQKVQIARHSQRPYSLDYIKLLFSDFIDLHGDRHFSDDPSIVGGLAKFEGAPLMVIGQQKGRDTKENLYRNFGMPHPEGYRKALRLMKLAEKYSIPIVTFIDTPGAFPGVGAEERGQSEAIAVNLREMSVLRVPIVVVIIGEGGSGGAFSHGYGR